MKEASDDEKGHSSFASSTEIKLVFNYPILSCFYRLDDT